MKLPRKLLEHKTMMIALIAIARWVAKAIQVDLNAPLAEICRAIDANRTSVYEQAGRILDCIRDLADTPQGRPSGSEKPIDDHAALRLRLKVFEYYHEHPGAICPQCRRTYYSPQLLRFILSLHDDWNDTTEAFALAAGIPIDTLRDWLRRDHTPLAPVVDKTVTLTRDASEIVRTIAKMWKEWQGPVKPFFSHAARSLDLTSAQVQRVLKIIGAISPRRRRKPFRFRGDTHKLAPGTMLVTDGKQVDVLLSSGNSLAFNWQAIVDQTTGCHTAVVVNHHECAQGIIDAFNISFRNTLGGVLPDALLHDAKPCYKDARLIKLTNYWSTEMICSSRAQSKAVVEGNFGLFEQRVGSINLDDSSTDALILSAVHEVIRAYTSATNSVPRCELDGRSRISLLQEYCPSLEQTLRDQEFLAKLKARHDLNRRRSAPDPTAFDLLDAVFERLDLLQLDQDRSLRRYMASFSTSAIRQAAAFVAVKKDRGKLKSQLAHRYLLKIVQSFQDELDLQRAADELLALCHAQNQSWTAIEEKTLVSLLAQHSGLDLATAVAEHAARASNPIQLAFWKNKLLDLLKPATHLIHRVRAHLVRFYEASVKRRLDLIDLISAHQASLL